MKNAPLSYSHRINKKEGTKHPSMHSHHSHSGEYISHGCGSLESMVSAVIAQKFTHYCLTEHMPRLSNNYLYPEEIEKKYTTNNLEQDFESYLKHAREIQNRYLNNNEPLNILVGFEAEGIDEAHIRAAKGLRQDTDMCLGSVHYVHGISIDFNRELWEAARNATAAKTTRNLYRDYFDMQYKVLTDLRPEVVAHFDLIRLFDTTADEIDMTTRKRSADIKLASDWPEVWLAITRNIQYIVSYGGLFELNSSAIRKGWASPYPRKDIALAIKDVGGKFCLSDDAHTPAQVGLNYGKMWKYITDDLRLSHVFHLELDDSGNTIVVSDIVADLSRLAFWTQ